MTQNPFRTAATERELLIQLAGYASRCWENLMGAGVFQSEEALRGVDAAEQRLKELRSAKIRDDIAALVDDELHHKD